MGSISLFCQRGGVMGIGRRVPVRVALAAVVVVASATFPGLSSGAARATAAGGARTPTSLPSSADADRQLAEATSEVAGFGGAFVDSDVATGQIRAFHVWLLEPNDAGVAAAREAVEAFAAIDLAGVDTVVHRARYSFRQLKAWHDAMTPVLALEGVAFTDVDETRNRLRVAMADPASQARPVLETLATLHIPADAVLLEEGASFRQLLRERSRPLRGGMQIQFQTGFLGLLTGTCTLGFPAVRSGVNGFVTNSHCSRTQGSVDNGRYWQPTRPPSDGDQVGTERVDPSFFTGGTCPSGRRCRFSDANFVSAATTIARGTIARVPVGTTDWNRVDLYRVTATGLTFTGLVVTKIGRTSGISSGAVSAYCVNGNVAQSDITILCTHLVDGAEADPGDSGSPVFRVTNSPNSYDVSLIGILWGESADPAQTIMAFSGYGNIEREIGDLSVCAGGFSC